MYKLKDEPYNFGIKHIEHRIFNETPAIKRQIVKVVEGSNLRGTLLNPKESFRESPVPPPVISSNMSGPAMIGGRAGNSSESVPLPRATEIPKNLATITRESNENIENVSDLHGIREGFPRKAKSKILKIFDGVLTTIITIAFLAFMGYIIYICFIEKQPSVIYTIPKNMPIN